jgi:predicted NUDIX family NTP pyrophosphohydrolase
MSRPVPHPTSAGVLLFRQAPGTLRVLLAHPGGPYFSNKDAGAWSIPKGLVNPDENLADAARREFEEELGWRPDGELLPLGEVRLRSGKRLVAFALHCDDSEETLLAKFRPGTFTMEWPPRSGRTSEFPEIDRLAFFSLDEAKEKMNDRQAPLLDRLVESLAR